ncbi:hypothetical protein BJ546DRAFT_950142 [Cryomyces antarcticus]|uniref:Uncharacterized protein n=1 Tax=Cryomyces antarcticus TaxID=329879 RepID=A0ABR0LZN2_9PEZI|nr:hypothetical protein LTR60_000749 [Cryomyces antarcticus]KAK5257274.1 hypothetical protein LTR16_001120 [Cryomyces antarcticus]
MSLDLLRARLILSASDICPPSIHARVAASHPHALSEPWSYTATKERFTTYVVLDSRNWSLVPVTNEAAAQRLANNPPIYCGEGFKVCVNDIMSRALAHALTRLSVSEIMHTIPHGPRVARAERRKMKVYRRTLPYFAEGISPKGTPLHHELVAVVLKTAAAAKASRAPDVACGSSSSLLAGGTRRWVPSPEEGQATLGFALPLPRDHALTSPTSPTSDASSQPPISHRRRSTTNSLFCVRAKPGNEGDGDTPPTSALSELCELPARRLGDEIHGSAAIPPRKLLNRRRGAPAAVKRLDVAMVDAAECPDEVMGDGEDLDAGDGVEGDVQMKKHVEMGEDGEIVDLTLSS